MNKRLLTLCAGIFGLVGASVPLLWGDSDPLSGAGIIFGVIGGLFGIWVGVKLSKRFG